MKKKMTKKLTLQRETLAAMEKGLLAQADGGLSTACYTPCTSICITCGTR